MSVYAIVYEDSDGIGHIIWTTTMTDYEVRKETSSRNKPTLSEFIKNRFADSTLDQIARLNGLRYNFGVAQPLYTWESVMESILGDTPVDRFPTLETATKVVNSFFGNNGDYPASLSIVKL